MGYKILTRKWRVRFLCNHQKFINAKYCFSKDFFHDDRSDHIVIFKKMTGRLVSNCRCLLPVA